MDDTYSFQNATKEHKKDMKRNGRLVFEELFLVGCRLGLKEILVP